MPWTKISHRLLPRCLLLSFLFVALSRLFFSLSLCLSSLPLLTTCWTIWPTVSVAVSYPFPFSVVGRRGHAISTLPSPTLSLPCLVSSRRFPSFCRSPLLLLALSCRTGFLSGTPFLFFCSIFLVSVLSFSSLHLLPRFVFNHRRAQRVRRLFVVIRSRRRDLPTLHQRLRWRTRRRSAAD